MAAAREAADPRAIAPDHQAVAVVLDFVDPQRTRGWPRHLRRLARFEEAGGMSRDHGRKMSIVMQRLLDPLCRRRALTILNA